MAYWVKVTLVIAVVVALVAVSCAQLAYYWARDTSRYSPRWRCVFEPRDPRFALSPHEFQAADEADLCALVLAHVHKRPGGDAVSSVVIQRKQGMGELRSGSCVVATFSVERLAVTS